MNWNFHNITVLGLSLVLIVITLKELFKPKNEKVIQYFYWSVLLSGLSVVQLILVDTLLTTLFPVLLLLFIPIQLLTPVIFARFNCWYLNSQSLFLKNKNLFLTPFFVFLVFLMFLNINLALQNTAVAQWPLIIIGMHSYEVVSVLLTLAFGVWNYRVIKTYENTFGEFPYQIVKKKTKWIKYIIISTIVMALIWAGVVFYTRLNPSAININLYYGLWYLVLLYCGYCFYLGRKHLKGHLHKQRVERKRFYHIADNFQLSALNQIFTTVELDAIQRSRHHATGILSYFATSLFDKQSVKDVLWDIVKNCIAKLGLEDCVIYMLDCDKGMLLQKAAFGNKEVGERELLSPIQIPLGKGIVGYVAKTGRWELVNDTRQDKRYILDDKLRRSELAVPIVHQSKVIGVLDSEHTQKDFFQEHHIFLFQLIAKLTATKLQQLSKKNTLAITNDNVYFKELCRLMKEEKVYGDPELGLVKMADKLSISPNYLSQMVNKLSNSNFSDFINAYRIEDSKSKLTDPSFEQYTIPAIGLEAGFNSRSAFYNAFKKHTGMTPSQYREAYATIS